MISNLPPREANNIVIKILFGKLKKIIPFLNKFKLIEKSKLPQLSFGKLRYITVRNFDILR